MWHLGVDRWALLVGVISLLLAYPVAVLGHVHDARWQNWWAERSIKSVEARIAKLEAELGMYEEKYKLLTEGEEAILSAVEGVALLCGLIATVAAVFLLMAAAYIPQLGYPDRTLLAALAGVVAIATFLMEIVFFGRFARFRVERSPTYRSQIKKSIDKLKERREKTRPA
jgi:hypothetical protein